MIILRRWIVMQKLFCFVFTSLFIGNLASCAPSIPTPTPTSAVKKIEPGDKIGDYLITTGKFEDGTFAWQQDTT
jgi:hypothetical protein